MVPMDMVVLAMLAMLVLAMLVLVMLAMLDTPMPMVLTPMPMVPITLARGLLMLSPRLTLMPLFFMVPMPMVPTATLDKKFFYFPNSIQKLFIIQELISCSNHRMTIIFRIFLTTSDQLSSAPFNSYLLSKSLLAAATIE